MTMLERVQVATAKWWHSAESGEQCSWAWGLFACQAIKPWHWWVVVWLSKLPSFTDVKYPLSELCVVALGMASLSEPLALWGTSVLAPLTSAYHLVMLSVKFSPVIFLHVLNRQCKHPCCKSFFCERSGGRELPSSHVPHSFCPSKSPSLAVFWLTCILVLRMRWYLLIVCSRDLALQTSSMCQCRIKLRVGPLHQECPWTKEINLPALFTKQTSQENKNADKNNK